MGSQDLYIRNHDQKFGQAAQDARGTLIISYDVEYYVLRVCDAKISGTAVFIVQCISALVPCFHAALLCNKYYPLGKA